MSLPLEFYQYLFIILKNNYTLVIVSDSTIKSYIDCIDLKNILLSDEMAHDLLMSGYVELDGGNFDFAETYYIRKDSWKKDLIDLKLNNPHFFRKQKIAKLLKDEK